MKKWWRMKKCRKNTAVTRDASVKQHDAVTRRQKYDACPAQYFFKSENWKKIVMWFLLNNKKQHWLCKFTEFLIISTIIHKNTSSSIWTKAQCRKTKLKRKIGKYLKEDAVQYFVRLSLLICKNSLYFSHSIIARITISTVVYPVL